VSRASSQLNRLRFHLQRLQADPSSNVEWEAVLEEAQALVADQLPAPLRPFQRLLAEALPALIDRRLPANLLYLQRELARTLAAQSQPKKPTASAEPSDLEQLAQLLRGREVLVIGGDPREHHRENLQQALRSAAVHWPVTRESAPDVSALLHYIQRREVALVLLNIRWIRHALNEVARHCDEHDKPLARITAGYNPAKVAHQALQQCSERLRRR
jgi:hypothetical protein